MKIQADDAMVQGTKVEARARATLCCVLLLDVLGVPGQDKVKMRKQSKEVMKMVAARRLTLPKFMTTRAELAITMDL